MNEKFKKLLLNLDLTITQVKIYNSLLEGGMQTVFEMGKDTGLVRSQIYSETIVLLQKGMIELAVKSPKKFIAVSPRKIKQMVADKKEKLSELEINLEEMANIFEHKFKKRGNSVSTKIFENRNIYKVFDFELQDAASGQTKEIYLITGDVKYQEYFLDKKFIDSFFKKANNLGVKMYILAHKEDSLLYEYFTRFSNIKFRFLSGLDIKVSMEVWDDKVIVSSFSEKEATCLLIENLFLAEGYKQIFKKLWSLAAPL